MTREEMATRLEAVNVSIDPNWRVGTVDKDYEADRDAIAAAAAELRKTCAGCKWSRTYDPNCAPYMECDRNGDETPADGSGFCHRWEVK